MNKRQRTVVIIGVLAGMVGLVATIVGIYGGWMLMLVDIEVAQRLKEQAPALTGQDLPSADVINAITAFIVALGTSPHWLALVVIGFLFFVLSGYLLLKSQ